MIGFYLIFYTTMTEVIGNDQAPSDQQETHKEGGEQTNNQEWGQKEEFVSKKDFYRIYWEKKSLEKKIQELEARIPAQKHEEDYWSYQKEDVDFIEKRAQAVAERKFQELSEAREKTQLQQKEEQAFLEAHPEAVQYLDGIYELKKNMAPNMSLVRVRKWYQKLFGDDEPVSRPASMWGNWSAQPKPKVEMSEEEAFATWLGRNK